MALRVAVASGQLPTIDIVGGSGRFNSRRGMVLLPRMLPGENRWLEFSLGAAHLKAGAPIVVVELVETMPVNGFALQPQLCSGGELAQAALRAHVTQCWRLAKGFGLEEAREQGKAARKLLRSRSFTPKRYTAFAGQQAEVLRALVALLVEKHAAGDVFNLDKALYELEKEAAAGKLGPVAAAHLTALSKLDAYQTLLHKAIGDPADIVQTLEWQIRLCQETDLARIDEAEALAAHSRRFIENYQNRRVGNEGYLSLIRRDLGRLSRIAGLLNIPEERISRIKDTLGDVAALQGAHRELLLDVDRATS